MTYLKYLFLDYKSLLNPFTIFIDFSVCLEVVWVNAKINSNELQYQI